MDQQYWLLSSSSNKIDMAAAEQQLPQHRLWLAGVGSTVASTLRLAQYVSGVWVLLLQAAGVLTVVCLAFLRVCRRRESIQPVHQPCTICDILKLGFLCACLPADVEVTYTHGFELLHGS